MIWLQKMYHSFCPILYPHIWIYGCIFLCIFQRSLNKFCIQVYFCITCTEQGIWCCYWTCSCSSETSSSIPGTKPCFSFYSSPQGIIDLVRFLCLYFPTCKSDLSFCLFLLFLLSQVGFCSQVQVLSDDSRLDSAAGKEASTMRDVHNLHRRC